MSLFSLLGLKRPYISALWYIVWQGCIHLQIYSFFLNNKQMWAYLFSFCHINLYIVNFLLILCINYTKDVLRFFIRIHYLIILFKSFLEPELFLILCCLRFWNIVTKQAAICLKKGKKKSAFNAFVSSCMSECCWFDFQKVLN